MDILSFLPSLLIFFYERQISIHLRSVLKCHLFCGIIYMYFALLFLLFFIFLFAARVSLGAYTYKTLLYSIGFLLSLSPFRYRVRDTDKHREGETISTLPLLVKLSFCMMPPYSEGGFKPR